ncbi:MAG: diguanylate cyclase [Oleibacter sp.]|nr:diguanylate cyclase [Thalassolituus sp.]
MQEPAPHFDTTYVRIRLIYCLLASLVLLVLAMFEFYDANVSHALFLLGLSVPIFLAGIISFFVPTSQKVHWVDWALIVYGIIFVVIAMPRDPDIAYWSFFVTGYIYFLLPFAAATALSLLYSIALVLIIYLDFASVDRMPLLFTYGACYAFSVMCALVDERNRFGMGVVVHTDPVTRVYNEYQLRLDLSKEMTRADRQSDELFFLVVCPPNEWHQQKFSEYEKLLEGLSDRLKNQLGSFQSCYRAGADRLVIMMPHSSFDQAEQFSVHLQSVLKTFALGSLSSSSTQQETSTTINVKMEKYYPEDSVGTLIKRLRSAEATS